MRVSGSPTSSVHGALAFSLVSDPGRLMLLAPDRVPDRDRALRNRREPRELQRAICTEQHVSRRRTSGGELAGQRDVNRYLFRSGRDAIGVQVTGEPVVAELHVRVVVSRRPRRRRKVDELFEASPVG